MARISEVVEVEKQVYLEMFKGEVNYKFSDGLKKKKKNRIRTDVLVIGIK